MTKRFALLFFAAVFSASAYAAETPLQVVARLYRDYAYEALFEEPLMKETLTTEPRKVMERYLDDSLIALLEKDNECAKREGICNLDFVPIWNSQDPTVSSHIYITSGEDPSIVNVRFTCGDREMKLKYHLVKTARGWRIADIDYPSQPSLATMLRGGAGR